MLNKSFFIALPLFFSCLSLTASAQENRMMDHSMHMQHMAQMNAAESDKRQVVDFPSPMRAHILSNMRDHLKAINEILAALGANQFTQAASIADSRLGVNADAATGCKPADTASSTAMSIPESMETRMAKIMPEGMRAMGQQMHQAASDFALVARKSAKQGNGKAAVAALAKVTTQCVACHNAFRAQ